ncbi:hypothetical protein Salat_2652200 [Sesamum alatum]|uniref:Uncharacterized protein n=1 Tax=Sesamum alatum TaxID=300844 RepID=A0AAE1XP30_9LAMI|nr:hypothetical protein Salat_2652200 [Sesamum alatum]
MDAFFHEIEISARAKVAASGRRLEEFSKVISENLASQWATVLQYCLTELKVQELKFNAKASMSTTIGPEKDESKVLEQSFEIRFAHSHSRIMEYPSPDRELQCMLSRQSFGMLSIPPSIDPM